MAAKCKSLGSPAVATIKADVASDADCKRMVAETRAALGGLDLLIANAGRGADNLSFLELPNLVRAQPRRPACDPR